MSAPPPLLLLRSVCGESRVVDRFYSLLEKRVVTKERERKKDDIYDDAQLQVVGSSHGWIALFERLSKHIILSNPLTGEHRKLPPLESLCLVPHSSLWVSKVILSSSSPEDKTCRAMMIAGRGDTLQFCSPAIDLEEWTPIGELLVLSHKKSEDDVYNRDIDYSNSCEDVVYSEDHAAFYSILPCIFYLDTVNYVVTVETWARDNLSDSAKPAAQNFFLKRHLINREQETWRWVDKNKPILKNQCVQIPHIVVFEKEAYIVLQFVQLMKSDNENKAVKRVPYCRDRGLGGYFHSKTYGFIVFKLHTAQGTMVIVDDLDGLAIFVGVNSSFAVRASEFDGLNKDTIYFSDSKRIKRIYGRKDNGCFDYRNKRVTHFAIDEDYEWDGGKSVYYYEDMDKSSPIWFFPPASAAVLRLPHPGSC